jgi:hypothetical protein
MKIQIFLIIYFSCLLFSCRKESDDTIGRGTATTNKDSKFWESELFAFKSGSGAPNAENKIAVFLETYSQERYLRSLLSFTFVPKKTGRFLFANSSSPKLAEDFCVAKYSDLVSDGDVVASHYNSITENADNYLEITEISGNKIRGNFRLTLVLDTLSDFDPIYPDTVRFVDGYFESN